MTSEFTVRYTEPLVRLAVARFWRRTIGLGFFLAVLALGAFVIREVSLGDRSWSVGMLGTAAALGAMVIVGSFAAQSRHHLLAFRLLETGEVTFAVGDQTLRMSSRDGASEFPWRLVREVWRYPELWILVFSKNSFSTLPLAGVPREALDALERHVSLAGGRLA